jgi:HEPN domain-containing protein
LSRSPRETGQRWLDQATEDLRWADHLAVQGGYHIACFLAQQVGEKALQAFLYAAGEEIVLGHSVERLCAEAGRYDPSFTEQVRRWAILDGFYVPTRYPSSIPDSIPARVYTADAAREAVRLARAIVAHVAERFAR